MSLTPSQTVITILAVAAGTMLTRFTPFILFPESKKQPEIIRYLSTMIPASMMGLLVVYCLKGLSFTAVQSWMPEFIAVAATALLHLWRKNVFISIGAGTALYMILVQFIFK